MKLWLKQTLLSLFIVLLSVSACLYFFSAVQTENLLRQAEDRGQRSLTAFCEHLSALDRNSPMGGGADPAARNALIQYTFSTYAHILQSGEYSYSLVSEGSYLYNVTPVDPLLRLPLAQDDLSARRALLLQDTPYLLYAKKLTVLQTSMTVYLTQNITKTYQEIDRLTRTAQLSLGACLLLCGLLLPLFFRKSLRPLKKLTRTAGEIAGGQYALRAEMHTPDEVGGLSAAFDTMAETIEQKILSLEDTAKRRELLLGALTHEMKTPMTAIIGYAQSILSMPLSEEGRMEAAGEIYEAARRTERLSQKMMQLIALTDCPALDKHPCETAALFEEVGKALAPFLAQKQMTLRTHIEAETLFGDHDLLFTLLTNLIHNAINASGEGTAVTLSAESRAGAARLVVSDEGSGIPADKIALVTEPFYRVDKARSRRLGGAGLGLSLCKMIAEAHDARLRIESRMGEGTAISIDLPGVKEETDHA